MSGKVRLAAFATVLVAFGLAGPVQAQTIDDVANTGEAPAMPGMVDLFWYFVMGASTDPAAGTSAHVITRNSAWVAPPAGSNWISENAQGNSVAPADQITTYYTNFFVTNPGGFSISGFWSSDNSAEMFLNGVSVGSIGFTAFTNLHAFEIDSGFESENTLAIQVYNGQIAPGNDTPNPTGLLVAAEVQATVTPEPISMTLLGTGLVGLGAAARRRKQRFEAPEV